MRIDEFEHVIAAAANVTGQDPEAPAVMLVSLEADIYPRYRPELVDAIDGALGDGSQFHVTYGYYAHGVGPETAKAPAGWEQRLVPVSVPPRLNSGRVPVAWCLEVHDLVLSKCAAGRQRDWDYAREALAARVVEAAVLLDRVGELPLDDAGRAHVASTLRAIIAMREEPRVETGD
jgi:hypothetical protein